MSTSEGDETYGREQFEEYERELHLRILSHEQALQLGLTFVKLAHEAGHAVAIGIDLGSRRVIRAGMPGTCSDHDYCLDCKPATVHRFDRASYGPQLRAAKAPQLRPRPRARPQRDRPSRRRGPLRVAGSTIGVAGVTGLRSLDDHRFTVGALRRCLANA